MKCTGYMKNWKVDNKVDKEGLPDMKIMFTVEVPFTSSRAKALADLTTGDSLHITLKGVQTSLDFSKQDRETVGQAAGG